MDKPTASRKPLALATIGVAALLLTACAGVSGSGDGGDNGGSSAASATSATHEYSASSAASARNGTSSAVSAEASASSDSSGARSKASTMAIGIDVPAPEGFDPLKTGTVFEGDITVTTSDGASLEDNYAVSTGNIVLNLRELQPLAQDKTVNIYLNSGMVELALPTGVPVDITCSANGGSCGEGDSNDNGEGETLSLNVVVNEGSVSITQ